jgi:hypothetical protein
MSEYSEYMKQARKEVELCLDTWKEIFKEHYSETIEYAYSKGSATKKWESFIDYVPILSDVDIHIKVKDHSNFFDDETSFYESVNISEMFETRFLEKNPKYFHIPRTQVIKLNKLINRVNFIHPREHEIITLVGKPELIDNPHADIIKRYDLDNLLELEEYLPKLSMSMMDRTGLELWSLLRRITWRVSPAPIRLLSQKSDNPLDIWGLNRTKVAEELENHDFYLIAENYKDYYYEGWIAFMEEFTNSQTLRRLISAGFEVMKLCLEEARRLV